jgi:hypothetical protein
VPDSRLRRVRDRERDRGVGRHVRRADERDVLDEKRLKPGDDDRHLLCPRLRQELGREIETASQLCAVGGRRRNGGGRPDAPNGDRRGEPRKVSDDRRGDGVAARGHEERPAARLRERVERALKGRAVVGHSVAGGPEVGEVERDAGVVGGGIARVRFILRGLRRLLRRLRRRARVHAEHARDDDEYAGRFDEGRCRVQNLYSLS